MDLQTLKNGSIVLFVVVVIVVFICVKADKRAKKIKIDNSYSKQREECSEKRTKYREFMPEFYGQNKKNNFKLFIEFIRNIYFLVSNSFCISKIRFLRMSFFWDYYKN